MTPDTTTTTATIVGTNPVKVWGLSIEERTRRLSLATGLAWGGANEASAEIFINARFFFDPAWFRHIAASPGCTLTMGGIPIMARAATPQQAEAIFTAMRDGSSLSVDAGLTILAIEDGPTIENKQLRKLETPFVDRLLAENVRKLERGSYFGAYKGVTDILTKYLWPEWALALTRIAAKIGMTPNQVTLIGAVLCVAATFAFAYGQYWAGMAMGLVFMVLDTVDGKLARCTVTSSWWGNIFDHGIDLVHPPFWWWFWATGLVYWGLALDDMTFWWVQGAIQGGYLVQRLIEGVFILWFDGQHIHVWQRFDSRFRLITARRNPNMVILFVFTLFGRPDIGIIAVAWWTVASLLVHVIRLLQAWLHSARGGTVTSWLAGESA